MSSALAFRFRRPAIAVIALALAALAIAGCGSSGESTASSGPASAKDVNTADFPQTDGKKSFEDIQKEVSAEQDANILPAANDFVAGRDNRLPFGLFDANRKPIWGPTVMYLSGGTGEPASGPYPVEAHDFAVPAKFQSETSKGDLDTIGNGFYTANIPANRGSKVNVLTLTKTASGTEAAAIGLKLSATDPAVAPGDKAPSIKTPTLASVGGDASKIDTRVPPDTMHAVSLDQALKEKKPIVLIFATPKLCASRVCGPVVDVASEVQAKEGKNVIFIHNEIYKDNDINEATARKCALSA